MEAGPCQVKSLSPKPIRFGFVCLVLQSIAFVMLWLVSGRWHHGTVEAIAASAILAAALLLLTYVDARHYWLPDVITLPLLGGGLVWSTLYGVGWLQAGIGGVVGYSLIASLNYIWRRCFKREGIGLGDAKLLAAAGAWLGPFYIPGVLVVASGVGLTLAIGVAIVRRSRADVKIIAFGPLLSLGVWICWCTAYLDRLVLAG